jgi:phenylalanyl-tRNA synthetase beta chain
VKISYQWMKDYLDLSLPPEEIGRRLTLAGFEVENIDWTGNDAILEVNVSANRPDALSFLGLAREIAIFLQKEVKYPPIEISEGKKNISNFISIKVEEPTLCFRYIARLIQGVKVGPSPEWLKQKVESVGLRSVNNIVDITNFVLMESGQPLHAFDFDKLKGKKIIVRKASSSEKLKALDGKEYQLDESILVIADAERPVALAGIIGGEETEVDDNTKNVLLESAYFERTGIRRSSKKLNIITESSFRFERGVDPLMVIGAAERATSLIQKIAGGTPAQGMYIFKSLQHPPFEPEITLRKKRIEEILSLNLSSVQIKEIFQKLNCLVKEAEESFLVKVPSFRSDLEEEIDLIEEIVRIIGYQEIPLSYPLTVPQMGKRVDSRLDKKIKHYLSSAGLNEVITYSFSSPEDLEKIKLPLNSPQRQAIFLKNPLSRKAQLMRTQLLTSLLEVAFFNFNRGEKDIRIFEIGTVFYPPPSEVSKPAEEIKMLGALAMGYEEERGWQTKRKKIDFFWLKGIVEGLLEKLNFSKVNFVRISDTSFHSGQVAKIKVKQVGVGKIGQLHPEVVTNYEMEGEIYYFELNLNQLYPLVDLKQTFKPLSKYPSVQRDLAVIADEKTPAAEIMELIKESGGEWVKKVSLFDFYQGPPIPKGKVNLAFSITYQNPKRTFKDEEINEKHKEIIEKITTQLPLQIRQ